VRWSRLALKQGHLSQIRPKTHEFVDVELEEQQMGTVERIELLVKKVAERRAPRGRCENWVRSSKLAVARAMLASVCSMLSATGTCPEQNSPTDKVNVPINIRHLARIFHS
jgi:hypothetical protein